jgi:hypothetical protein
MLHYFDFEPDLADLGFLIYGAGMVVFPLLIIHLFFRKTKLGHFALYLFIQTALGAITIMTLVVADNAPSQKENLIYAFMPIPSVLFFGEIINGIESPMLILVGLFWLGIGLLLPLGYAMPLFKEMLEVHRSNRTQNSTAESESEA